MILLNRFIRKSVKSLGDFLGHDSEIVAAVEISEATDVHKAIDVIKRSIKSGTKEYVVVVIEV